MPAIAKKKTTAKTTVAAKNTATKKTSAKKAANSNKTTTKVKVVEKTTKKIAKISTKAKVQEKPKAKNTKKVNISTDILSQVKAEVKESKKVKKTAITQEKPLAVRKSRKSVKEKAQDNVAVFKAVPAVIPENPAFEAGDFVVYPAHGVGQVEGIDIQYVSGIEIALYTIVFEKDRMRLKIPVTKAKDSGLRKLSSKDRLKDALATLQGRSQTRRIMWSRRAQEYETKINSGDPVAIAEVLRDLKKDDVQSEQSYSERQIYQAALERLAREVAAIEDIAEDQAVEKLEVVLSKIA